jgi:hypothetical protein
MYQGGGRLPAEKASKLSHLDVLNSELVNKLLADFESPLVTDLNIDLDWKTFSSEAPLDLIFAVDGSLQVIQGTTPSRKELAFVKTALLKLSAKDIEGLDKDDPHPLALKKLMSDSALYHATVFPLKFVNLQGLSVKESVRRIIYDSLKDSSLGGAPMETLKWISFKIWRKGTKENSPDFECPYKNKDDPKDIHLDNISFQHGMEIANCKYCKKEIYLSDMLGFHLEMDDENVQGSVASAYMLIHELLLLFTGIRLFWEEQKFKIISRCLFLKDGPLTLRSQYSKIVPNLRDFFEYAKEKKVVIHLVGQEKTGAFVEHFNQIERERLIRSLPQIKDDSYLLLSNDYIKHEIQRRPGDKSPYGDRTNYGNKIFVKLGGSHCFVLSIPIGAYKRDPSFSDYMGIIKILSTLKAVRSFSHENAIVPIELANGVASLSTYPSAKVLQLFSESF